MGGREGGREGGNTKYHKGEVQLISDKRDHSKEIGNLDWFQVCGHKNKFCQQPWFWCLMGESGDDRCMSHMLSFCIGVYAQLKWWFLCPFGKFF